MLDPEVVRRLRLTLHGNMLDRLAKADLRALLADWERRGEALRAAFPYLDDDDPKRPALAKVVAQMRAAIGAKPE